MNDIYERLFQYSYFFITRCKDCKHLYMGKPGCYVCGVIGCAIDLVLDEDCAKLNEESDELKMNMEEK